MLRTKRAPSPVQAVVFDGDDTLWTTEQLYDDARAAARNIVVAQGIDGTEWEILERRIDVENVAILGFGFERFPTSCVQAYEQLCAKTGKQIDPRISDKIREAACSVFYCEPQVAVGARNALSSLRQHGFKLALLTKGDPELQLRRVESSGLKDCFDVIKVVVDKTPEVIRELLTCLGVGIESACMVGNSARSDILPALATGMRAIWVQSHVWEYERTDDHLVGTQVSKAADLDEVARLIMR